MSSCFLLHKDETVTSTSSLACSLLQIDQYYFLKHLQQRVIQGLIQPRYKKMSFKICKIMQIAIHTESACQATTTVVHVHFQYQAFS